MANDKPTGADHLSSDSDVARVVEARQRLMARFAEKLAATPSLTDDSPQGTGLKNRHGMPAVPVGQIKTEKWPILDLGRRPGVTRQGFQLVVDGAVATPVTLDWAALLRLPQIDDVSAGPHRRRTFIARRARRPPADDHAAAVCMEGQQVGQPPRAAHCRRARLLGRARLLDDRTPVAQRSLPPLTATTATGCVEHQR